MVLILYRGERKSYYENTFIQDDELVEEHLNKIYSHKSAKVWLWCKSPVMTYDSHKLGSMVIT
jgi:hypothetical protein